MAPHATDHHCHADVWQLGILNRLPWLGFTALFAAVACMVMAAAVGWSSNGADIDTWPYAKHQVQPAVILSLLSAVANTCLRYAFSEGVVVKWWGNALRGSTLEDLHNSWSHGSSLKNSVTSWRDFGVISLACIVTSLIVVDGPLLQRSSSVTTKPASRNVTLSISLSADALPMGFSGTYMTHAPAANLYTDQFARIFRDYTARSDITLDNHGCSGTCDTVVAAPGFDINCTHSTQPYEMHGRPGSEYNVGSIFVGTNGQFNAGNIEAKVVYKDDTPKPCKGSLTVVDCSFQLATVRYPITLRGSSVSIGPSGKNDTIKVQYPPSESPGLGISTSTLGGISLAVDELYNSNVSLFSAGKWAVEGTGPMRNTYLSRETQSVYDYMDCSSLKWNDPTPDIISTLRELMFRSAISVSNSSTRQEIQASKTFVRTTYVSNYKYMAGALSIMLVDTVIIFPLFLGWWLLGRKVSMSPLELAKAFRSPILARARNNGADGLLSSLGKRKVRYGELSLPNMGAETRANTESQEALVYEMQDMAEGNDAGRPILAMGDEREINRPVPGTAYG